MFFYSRMIDFYTTLLRKTNKYSTKYGDHTIISAAKIIFWGFQYIIGCLLNKLTLKKNVFKNTGNKSSPDTISIVYILDGGVGDIVNWAVYIKKFSEKLDCKYNITLATTQPTQIIQDLLHNQPFITNIISYKDCDIHDYDLVIKFNSYLPKIISSNTKKIKKLSKFLPNFIKILEEFAKKHQTLTIGDTTFYQQHYCLITDKNSITAMDIGNMLGLRLNDGINLHITDNSRKILQQHALNNKPFITIQRGLDINNNNTLRNIRLWPIEHYNELIKLLKSRYPNIRIVQLGSSASKCISIDGVDINLVGKTTFSECMALLDASALHIDCECGMTHVRHFLCQKPSVVLFGPTSPITRGHPENINLRSNVCNCELCEWLIGGNWQHKCIKSGTDLAPCMHAITPQMVIDAIKKYDDGKLGILLSSVV